LFKRFIFRWIDGQFSNESLCVLLISETRSSAHMKRFVENGLLPPFLMEANQLMEIDSMRRCRDFERFWS
jgi:hypothetical protein